MQFSELAIAIKLIKAGQKSAGARILRDFLRDHPENVVALLWLSEAIKDDHEKRAYLEKILSVDPQNALARRGLLILCRSPSWVSRNSVALEGIRTFSPRNQIRKEEATIRQVGITNKDHISWTGSQDRETSTRPRTAPPQGHVGWKPQCPHCGSYKTGGKGLTAGGWIFHIVMTLLTSGIWLVLVLLYYVVVELIEMGMGKKDALAHPVNTCRCRNCGYIWQVHK